MKKLLLLVIIFLSTNVCAIDNTKYATAKNGLRMRESPNINSKIILKISHNEKVQIIEQKSDPVIFDNISGNWTKVKYNNTVGWVFGGFLGNLNFSDKFNIGLFYNEKVYIEITKDDIIDEMFLDYIKKQTINMDSNSKKGLNGWLIENLDKKYIADCLSIKVNDKFIIKSQTKSSVGIVKDFIFTYEPAGSNIFHYALLETNIKFLEKENLIAGKTLKLYPANYKFIQPVISKTEVEKINKYVEKTIYNKELSKYVKYSTGSKFQYMLYMTNTTDIDNKWKTVILNDKFETVSVLGEDSYINIIPKKVFDFDADGINELLVSCYGYEGGNDAFYFQEKNGAFKIIKYNFFGM